MMMMVCCDSHQQPSGKTCQWGTSKEEITYLRHTDQLEESHLQAEENDTQNTLLQQFIFRNERTLSSIGLSIFI